MFYKYLEQIEGIGSTLEKHELLKNMLRQYPKSEQFLRFAFSDRIWGIAEQSFYNAFEIKNKFEHVSSYFDTIPNSIIPYSVENMCAFLEPLYKSSGNDLLMKIKVIFSTFNNTQAKWWCRALLKDLRAGIQLKSVNAAFKELGLSPIGKFSVQLAGKFNIYNENEWAKYMPVTNFALERKMNGNRIEAEVFPDGRVILMSRRGKDNTDKYPEVISKLKELFPDEYHKFDGEIIAGDSTQKLARKNDNTKRQYVIYDLLDDERIDYTGRWDNLFNIINPLNLTSTDTIYLVEHYNGICQQDAIDYFEHCYEQGYEGIMLKLYNKPYERDTRKNMFKFKKDYDGKGATDVDLKVVNFEYGSGRLHNRIASLILTDASVQYRIKCGSGITDEIREELEKLHACEKLIGSVVEIRFNEFTETGSVTFPRFIRIRDPSDKDYADDLNTYKR
jgi:hypothetical protein